MNRPGAVAFFSILVLMSGIGFVSTHTLLPALPTLQESFGVSAGVVQLTFSLGIVSIAVSTLVYGPLSDRFGRKPVILAGLLISIVGSIVCLFAPSIGVLVVGRVLQTGGAAVGMVIGRSIVRDVYGDRDTARIMSYLFIAIVGSTLIAPLLGGLLTDGFGWRSVFIFMTAATVLIGAAVWLWLEETNLHIGSVEREHLLDGLRRLARQPAFWGYTLQTATAIATFYSFLAAAPFLMAETLGRPAREFGFWFPVVAGTFAFGNYLSTRLLRWFDVHLLIVTGSCLCLCSVATAAVLHWFLPLSATLLFVPMIAVSLLQGPVIANAQAGAINVDPTAAGAAAGLSSFMQMAVGAAGIQIVGMLNDGTVWPMLATMFALCAIGVASLPLIRRRPAAPAEAEAEA